MKKLELSRIKIRPILLYNNNKETENAIKIKGIYEMISGNEVEMYRYEDADNCNKVKSDEYLLLLAIRPESQQSEIFINAVNMLKYQIQTNKLFLIIFSDKIENRFSLVNFYSKAFLSLFRSILVLKYLLTEENTQEIKRQITEVITFMKKCDKQLISLSGMSSKIGERLVKMNLQINLYNKIGELISVGYTMGINSNGMGARISSLFLDELELKKYLGENLKVVFQEEDILGISPLTGVLERVEKSRDKMYDNFIALSFNDESHLINGGKTRKIINRLIEQQLKSDT